MKWIAKNAAIVIISVIVLIVIIVLLSRLFKDKDNPKDKQLLSGDVGGDIPDGWYPDDITSELYDVIDGIDSITKKDVAATKFNTLLDNQKILVYNDWNHKYSAKTDFWGNKFGTLTKSIRDEWDKGPQMTIAMGNLERLKLP